MYENPEVVILTQLVLQAKYQENKLSLWNLERIKQNKSDWDRQAH